ncbi:hypothetical protein Q5H93_20035 [Hymenobacter sp. ASUV-10]|uniref:Fibronectin type-III domain-containing protein n=1 Tax=Hymenobacter aranciens TaxID=3063996 RepID=A0ABT9BGX9_9BACT|nr:hypothetical protein [Hymenobacter sp. ASUV-10]MDO7877045.1 hypothetical protein [Hymenobacter sp. ASUV-10]
MLWWSALAATAQVANDNIDSRRVLQLEETVTSSTTGCTVQRACVDERLTGKCIEYHNDQWFEFTPPAPGRYFVNIGGQKCRDIRGVQLVVLAGQPCQPATYQVLSCTSLGMQDDVFVELNLPRAGQSYLLNVDGYLKDFCQFTLQVSHQASGIPALSLPTTPSVAPALSARIVTLSWQLPDSLGTATSFRVLRHEQHDFRSQVRSILPVGRDTYGTPLPDYNTTDTLTAAGLYCYQITTDTQPPVLLQQRWVAFERPISAQTPLAATATYLELPLRNYPRNSNLSVVISDPQSGRVLTHRQLVNQPGNARQAQLPAAPWQAAGLQKIAVEITCHPPRGRFFTDHLLLDVPPPAAGR